MSANQPAVPVADGVVDTQATIAPPPSRTENERPVIELAPAAPPAPPAPPTGEQRDRDPDRQRGTSNGSDLLATREKIAIYTVAIAVLVVASVALFWWMQRTASTYDHASEVIAASQPEPDQLASSAVALLAMRDAIFLKSVIVFVAFLFGMLGCLFVLKGVEASYRLGVRTGTSRVTLGTASPGLILISVAAALCAYSLSIDSAMSLDFGGAGDQQHATDSHTEGGPDGAARKVIKGPR